MANKVLYECNFCGACGWHEDVGPIIIDYCPDVGEEPGSGLKSTRLSKEKMAEKLEDAHPKIKDRYS